MTALAFHVGGVRKFRIVDSEMKYAALQTVTILIIAVRAHFDS